MAELDMDKIVKDAIDSLVIDGKSLSEWVQLIKEYEEHKQKSYTGCESKIVIDGNGNTTIVVKHGWISVKDRLPDIDKYYGDCMYSADVFVYDGSRRGEGYYCHKTNMWHNSFDEEIIKVTHWMPLPEPPKEDV